LRSASEILSAPTQWGWESRASLVGVASVTLLVVGWLYLGLPLPFLPLVLGMGVLAAVTLRNPVVGVLGVVAAQYLPFTFSGLSVFQLLGVFVTLLCLVHYGLTRRGLTFSWIVAPILAFSLLALQSLSFTHDVAMTQYFVRKLLFNALFCILLISVIDDLHKLRWLLWTIMGIGAVNSLVAAVQFVLGYTLEFRAKGLLENENQLGELAAMGLVVALYAFLYARRRWQQTLSLLICAFLAVGLVTSISRGAILALLAGLSWVLFREGRQRKRLVLFVLLVALVIPYLPKAFFHRFEKLNSEVRGTISLSQRVGLSNRGYYNKAGIKIWKAHPVFGVGLGNYGFYYIQPEFNPGLKGGKKLPPHNIYIQALAETGTVGFLVLCWWILQAGFNYWRAEKESGGSELGQAALRAGEALTIVWLVFNFAAGSLVYTDVTMVMTMSFICRRCLAKERLGLSRLGAGAPNLPEPAQA
jgi:O-antigen ligase